MIRGVREARHSRIKVHFVATFLDNSWTVFVSTFYNVGCISVYNPTKNAQLIQDVAQFR